MPYSLPRSASEHQGVDPAAVARFIDEIEAEKIELHSFMLLRHGNVVAEGSWKPYEACRPHMLFSLSKSFTSTAVGFAVSEGLLSVDDPVLRFFKEDIPEKHSRHWDELKVKHLLTMSTGHAADTMDGMGSRRDDNWARGFLRQPLKYKPGTHFLYNTGATYMLSVIVQKRTGQRVLDYLTPRLFHPLGIEGAAWEQCPMGYDTGGFGLSLKTEDIAKFGQFLLQRGMWEGQQLLPAAWIDEATSKQVENGDETSDWAVGYGYQFWRCVPGCYRGDGAFGQYCIVMPRQDAVIAITSGVPDMPAVLKLIWSILLPAMGDGLQDDPPRRKAMEARLAALQYTPPALQESSPLESALSGKTYALEKNPDHRKSVRYAFSSDTLEVEETYSGSKVHALLGGGVSRGGAARTVYGRGKWAEGPVGSPTGPALAVASFTWESEHTLILTTRFVNTPIVTTEKVRFEGDGVESVRSVNVSFGPKETVIVKGVLKK